MEVFFTERRGRDTVRPSGTASPWRPNNNNPWHTHTHTHPYLLALQWNAAANSSEPSWCSLSSWVQCLLSKEMLRWKNRVNCLGYNRSLPVRPSPFPLAIRAHFPPSTREQAVGSTHAHGDSDTKKFPPVTCSSFLQSMYDELVPGCCHYIDVTGKKGE